MWLFSISNLHQLYGLYPSELPEEFMWKKLSSLLWRSICWRFQIWQYVSI